MGHEIKIFSWKKNEIRLHDLIIENDLMSHVKYLDLPERYIDRVKLVLKVLIHDYHLFIKLSSTLNVLKYRRGAINLKIFGEQYLLTMMPESDVLHSHFGPNGIKATIQKKIGLCKADFLIASFHGFDSHACYARQGVYDELYRFHDLLTANTSFTLNQLLKNNGPIDKIEIVPESLYFGQFDSFKKNNIETDNELVILYVGRLVDFKGADRIPRIAKRLRERVDLKFKFILIGEGELRKKIESDIKIHGLENLVLLKGALTQQDVIGYYANADIFLLPGVIASNGRQENQGLVIQEAQFMQLPVVVSNTGGVSEGVLNGKTGFVLPSEDIDAFVDKLVLLIHNPSLRLKMGMEGRKFISDNYDSLVLAKKLEKLVISKMSL